MSDESLQTVWIPVSMGMTLIAEAGTRSRVAS